MKPIIVTSGEPAGIGPDICLSLANSKLPLVVVADIDLLRLRAKQLGVAVNFRDYAENTALLSQSGSLNVLNIKCPSIPIPGELNPDNAGYVLEMLAIASEKTLRGEFSAIVTAPVHKGVINQSGVNFSGHTEFFAEVCGVEDVVMMLSSPKLRVALLTTHIPLKDVAKSITPQRLEKAIQIIYTSFQNNYAVHNPKICVAGLNPHAGEGGHIGREEEDIISPTLRKLKMQGLNLVGPLSADTMYISESLQDADCFLSMYHDQGLPVLKYSSFGAAVNVTLGLPIIRTSVDHGTALQMAATGRADSGSLFAAITEAIAMQNAGYKQFSDITGFRG